MKTAKQSDRDVYRVIVVRRDASEILLVSSETGLSLPCVEITPQRRIAPQLIAEVNRQWNLQTYCLFVPGFMASDRSWQLENYAVLESSEENEEPPEGTCWMPRTVSANQHDLLLQDCDAISESLRELDLNGSKSNAAPFGRPGWLRELFAWTQDQLSPLGLRLTMKFSQFNASPTFSLIRLETSGFAAWFKATGEPNLHELPITLCLAQLFPGYLPPILGIQRAWNGWLSQEVSDTTLDQCAALPDWEMVAETLARLQIDSIGKCCALLDAQCKDLRLRRLMDLIPTFLTCMAELMAAQEKQSPPPLTARELDFLARRLREDLLLLESIGLPDTLGHLDFNPGNILISPARCVFLDWAEACATNPFLTFEYLCEHARHNFACDATASARVTNAYLRPWASLLSPAELAKALTLSPLIAVYAYAIAIGSWAAPDMNRNSTQSRYLRSLTRRMHVEAMRQANGKNGGSCSSQRFGELVPSRTLP
jgi:hypothetical protein